MDKILTKKKVGKPLKHDFSGLAIGEAVPFKGKARANPNPYAAYWNSHKALKIEVVWDSRGIPYARRIL